MLPKKCYERNYIIMTRKLLALALVVLMLTAVFIGCKEPAEDPADETTPLVTTPPETTVDTSPVFVEKDYGGADFTVYMRKNGSTYGGKYITPLEDITDPMEAATYERNVMVEEKYKVKLVSIEATNPTNELAKAYESGDVNFDMILDQRSKTAPKAQEGYLYDWNKIDHISWDRSWWDKNVKDGYTINGKLYMAINDISIGNLTGARFLYFNKKLVKDFNLKDPYTLVENNGWTLDEVLSMIKAISVENGDGVWNGQDQYGLLTEASVENGNIMYFLAAAGIRYVETDANGKLIVNGVTDKMLDIMNKVRTVLVDTNYVCSYDQAQSGADTAGLSKWNYARNVLFTTDHFLFVQNGMGVSTNFKDMESDYGVAPNPKYDSAQDTYYHKIDRYAIIWSLPNSDKVDYDRIGVIAEYWAYVSSQTVMPAYYETTIQTKIMRDPTDTKMLDLIKSTMIYDMADLVLYEAPTAIYNGYKNNNSASEWESAKEKIESKLAELNEAYANLG